MLRKCTGCADKSRYDPETMMKLPGGWFHSIDCATAHGRAKAQRAREKAARKTKQVTATADKEWRKETRRMREKALTRSELYAKLQKLVNQFVLHVRDKDEPCCTCGTTKPVKYDAGHYLAAGRMPELRFELTNIHKQCSSFCNLHGSGKRGEYDPFIVAKYGRDHFDWLNGPHKPLKDTFPHTDDIRYEIDRYRVILREAGLKPRI